MSDTLTGSPALDAVNAALATVQDPEINRPLTELGMVKDVQIGGDRRGRGRGLPDRRRLPDARDDHQPGHHGGVRRPRCHLGAGRPGRHERRAARELRKTVRGTDAAEPGHPFAQPGSLTRVYAVASGKGGVGKSIVTVNLAPRWRRRASRWVSWTPTSTATRCRGCSGRRQADPGRQHDHAAAALGVKVISIGMFTPGNTPVVWRGPMLHRALQQFLADVWWGDLDVLLLDLPPGTGDVAISIAQLLPNAEILVVTTPQLAAAEVAERAGAIATQTHQQVVGVIENMSWLELPDGSRMEVFGSGGGRRSPTR
jgi:ATP-binding protein involved in chromosome partitioning